MPFLAANLLLVLILIAWPQLALAPVRWLG
jgi:hypothetical protein